VVLAKAHGCNKSIILHKTPTVSQMQELLAARSTLKRIQNLLSQVQLTLESGST